jgi:hypothetical protein
VSRDSQTIEERLAALDRDIEAQGDYGNTHYKRTLQNIRGALEDLDRRIQRTHAARGIRWLIECSFEGGRPEYYCGPREWCSNPYHAHKFLTKGEADEVSNAMTTIGDRRVTEHSWE